jgi:hypothetical protein
MRLFVAQEPALSRVNQSHPILGGGNVLALAQAATTKDLHVSDSGLEELDPTRSL